VLKGVLGLSDADLEKLAADKVIGTQPILPERRKVQHVANAGADAKA